MVNIYIIKLPPFYPLSFTLAPYLKFFTVAKMFEPKAFYLKSFFSPYLVYLIFQPVFKIQLVALILKTDVAVIKEPVLHEVSYRHTELCFQSWDLLFIYRLCPLLFAWLWLLWLHFCGEAGASCWFTCSGTVRVALHPCTAGVTVYLPKTMLTPNLKASDVPEQ